MKETKSDPDNFQTVLNKHLCWLQEVPAPNVTDLYWRATYDGTSPWSECLHWHQQWRWRRLRQQKGHCGYCPARGKMTPPCHCWRKIRKTLKEGNEKSFLLFFLKDAFIFSDKNKQDNPSVHMTGLSSKENLLGDWGWCDSCCGQTVRLVKQSCWPAEGNRELKTEWAQCVLQHMQWRCTLSCVCLSASRLHSLPSSLPSSVQPGAV